MRKFRKGNPNSSGRKTRKSIPDKGSTLSKSTEYLKYPNNSTEHKVDGWDEWLEMRPERSAGPRS